MNKRIKKKDSISIIIPAFNEEESIIGAIKTITEVVEPITNDYEIIIVNDGSTDRTQHIVDVLAKKNKHVHVLTHQKNEGIGISIRDGIKHATKKYITGFPGDNDVFHKTFKDLLQARRADSIVSLYMTSMSEREIIRKVISKSFTSLMNTIFGLNLRYYNGYFICPRSLFNQVTLKSEGFTIFSEVKIKLIKQGVNIIEVAFDYKPRLYGSSKALTWKSISQTIQLLPVLVKDIYVGT